MNLQDFNAIIQTIATIATTFVGIAGFYHRRRIWNYFMMCIQGIYFRLEVALSPNPDKLTIIEAEKARLEAEKATEEARKAMEEAKKSKEGRARAYIGFTIAFLILVYLMPIKWIEKYQNEPRKAWAVFWGKAQSESSDGRKVTSDPLPVSEVHLDVQLKSNDGRYIASSEGVIHDTKTGIDWYVGPDKGTTWYEAKKWADGLTVANGKWRLPIVEEESGIYEKGKGNRHMDTIFNTSGWWIWCCDESSSPSAPASSSSVPDSSWFTRDSSRFAPAFYYGSNGGTYGRLGLGNEGKNGRGFAVRLGRR